MKKNELLHAFMLISWITILLSACTTAASSPSAITLTSTPISEEDVPVTNAEGTAIASQPGPVWVLLSGVNDHGYLEEPQLSLYSEPSYTSDIATEVTSGLPALVLEIRHLGEGGLQRFYRVQSQHSASGWISDYYVNRSGYLFNVEDDRLPVYDAPNGAIVEQVENVTEVMIVDPLSDADWWQVRLLDKDSLVWVQKEYVRESSKAEFLLNLTGESSYDQ